jgi:hypothetical protein
MLHRYPIIYYTAAIIIVTVCPVCPFHGRHFLPLELTSHNYCVDYALNSDNLFCTDSYRIVTLYVALKYR